MKLTYFYRNHRVGYSIKKVSDLFVSQMKDKCVYEMPSQYASIKGILLNMFFTFLHRDKKGINHVTGDIHYCILPLMGCKNVLTVHDTVAYDQAKGWKKTIIKYLWFVWPLKFATKVVCISDATRLSLRRFTKRSDILVIPNAVDPTYAYSPRTFDESHPNILLIGTSWNKNIERTVRALKNIDCRFSIIGPLTESQRQTLKECNTKYDNKQDLTDNEIRHEYESSDIICFCSVFEGFGMPIIEGNAIGRPVITSNISPMTEVAADAALLANPYDEADIRSKIVSLIDSKELRSSYVERGLANSLRFQQCEIVDRYKTVYKEIAKM